MKKFILIPLAIFILNTIGFAQNTGDKEVMQLNNDVRSLKKENTNMKKEVAGDIDSLNRSLADMKGSFQAADKRINTAMEMIAAANSTVSAMQVDTNNRFLKYRGIIKYSIIIGLLLMCAMIGMIMMQYFKSRKEFNMVNRKLASNETALANLSDKLAELKESSDRQISSTQEVLNAKIRENHKLLDGQIVQVGKTAESSQVALKAQFDKEIGLAKQEAASDLKALKTGFEAQIEEIKKNK